MAKIKEQQIEVKPKWDLSDPLVRQELWKFEKELLAIMEADKEVKELRMAFYLWCVKRGKTKLKFPHNQIVKVESRVYGVTYKKLKTGAYFDTVPIDLVEKFYALQTLREKRRYAKEMEEASKVDTSIFDEQEIKPEELPF